MTKLYAPDLIPALIRFIGQLVAELPVNFAIDVLA